MISFPVRQSAHMLKLSYKCVVGTNRSFVQARRPLRCVFQPQNTRWLTRLRRHWLIQTLIIVQLAIASCYFTPKIWRRDCAWKDYREMELRAWNQWASASWSKNRKMRLHLRPRSARVFDHRPAASGHVLYGTRYRIHIHADTTPL